MVLLKTSLHHRLSPAFPLSYILSGGIHDAEAFNFSSPRSHYDVILIVTSFATELATPTVTDGVRMDSLLRLIYKDVPTDDVLYCRCNVVTLTMMQSNCTCNVVARV